MTTQPVLNSIAKLVKNKTQQNNKKIKKRHWCLASVILLVGSWITHTTTANISKQNGKAKLATTTNNTSFKAEPFRFVNQQLSPLARQKPATTSNEIDGHLLLLPHAIAAESENLIFETYKIKKGDSLGIIFRKLKLGLSLPYKISQHKKAKQLVSISAGKKLIFGYDEEQNLRRIQYPLNTLQNFVVKLDDGTISEALIVDLPYKMEQRLASGEIQSSLYQAAQKAGISDNTIMEMVHIFGWDVDFVLDIRAGDHFHVIYDRYMLDGQVLKDGTIVAAEFSTQGRTYRAIRYQNEKGDISYYTPEGDSMLGTFLRSPVKFSRISSRFGKRKHPILKTWRAHKGVDYAAPPGTPIRATADGRVTHKGSKGGYGRTVIISHAGRFSTLYAHMKGYAKKIKAGSHVKQGDIIGYVGSSGLSTGPHLHYEFRVDGVHRNPLTYKTPKAKAIEGKSKSKFLIIANTMQIELDKLASDYQIAKALKTTINR